MHLFILPKIDSELIAHIVGTFLIHRYRSENRRVVVGFIHWKNAAMGYGRSEKNLTNIAAGVRSATGPASFVLSKGGCTWLAQHATGYRQ